MRFTAFMVTILASLVVQSCAAESEVEPICLADTAEACPDPCYAVVGYRLLEEQCVSREQMACGSPGDLAVASTGCVVRVRDGAVFWVWDRQGVVYGSPEWRECGPDEQMSVAHVDQMLQENRSCPQ